MGGQDRCIQKYLGSKTGDRQSCYYHGGFDSLFFSFSHQENHSSQTHALFDATTYSAPLMDDNGVRIHHRHGPCRRSLAGQKKGNSKARSGSCLLTCQPSRAQLKKTTLHGSARLAPPRHIPWIATRQTDHDNAGGKLRGVFPLSLEMISGDCDHHLNPVLKGSRATYTCTLISKNWRTLQNRRHR